MSDIVHGQMPQGEQAPQGQQGPATRNLTIIWEDERENIMRQLAEISLRLDKLEATQSPGAGIGQPIPKRKAL
jgi:hypothetical protein